MMQVELFLKGEQDYSRISGPTGPLVYVSPVKGMCFEAKFMKATPQGTSTSTKS
jgi:hypothetical protein